MLELCHMGLCNTLGQTERKVSRDKASSQYAIPRLSIPIDHYHCALIILTFISSVQVDIMLALSRSTS